MLVVTRYRVDPEGQQDFLVAAGAALDALVASSGCTEGRVGRAVDEPSLWTLTTTWDSVGSYRRALSGYEVKLHAVPLMYRALDESTAYEDLLIWTPSGGSVRHPTAIAADGGTVPLGGAGTPSAPVDID